MKLNVGCGFDIRKDYVNIDKKKLPGVDVVRDVLRGLPYADDVADEIMCYHVLEHIPQVPEDNVYFVMSEFHRVLKPGGMLHIRVPYANSAAAWQDPTHCRCFNERSFLYFDNNITRWMTEYGYNFSLKLVAQTLLDKDGPEVQLEMIFKK